MAFDDYFDDDTAPQVIYEFRAQFSNLYNHEIDYTHFVKNEGIQNSSTVLQLSEIESTLARHAVCISTRRRSMIISIL